VRANTGLPGAQKNGYLLREAAFARYYRFIYTEKSAHPMMFLRRQPLYLRRPDAPRDHNAHRLPLRRSLFV